MKKFLILMSCLLLSASSAFAYGIFSDDYYITQNYVNSTNVTNITYIFSSNLSGNGTTNYIPYWTNSTNIWASRFQTTDLNSTSELNFLFYPLNSNPAGYLTSFTEVDPIWTSVRTATYNNWSVSNSTLTTFTNALNANKSGLGTATCSAGFVVQNVTTTTGVPTVQCVADANTDNVTGTGVSGNLTLWTGTSTLGSSLMYQTNGNIGLFNTNPTSSFYINSSNSNGSFVISNSSNERQLLVNGTTGQLIIGPTSLTTFSSDSGQPIKPYVYISNPNTPVNASANGIDADAVLYVQGVRGGNTSIATTGTGGRGSQLSFYSGFGGEATNALTASTGGQGGSINFIPGDGGDVRINGSSSTGGNGGYLNFFSGNGGSALNGTSTIRGGVGGTINLNAGYGGGANFKSGGTGGKGGDFVLAAGAGGAANNGTAGTGGAVQINSGQGGSNPSATGGAGGDIQIFSSQGGSGTTQGDYGDVLIGSLSGFFGAAKRGNVVLQGAFGTRHGNVSIGTASPQAFLHQNAGTATATYHKFTAGTTTGTTASDGTDIGISSNGETQIRNYENRNLTLWTNNLERVRLTNLGRTGFNITTPNQTVEVSGGLQSQNFYSADGTVGFSGTCTIASITSITVKNGLITGCS